jgi:hypothetical protein
MPPAPEEALDEVDVVVVAAPPTPVDDQAPPALDVVVVVVPPMPVDDVAASVEEDVAPPTPVEADEDDGGGVDVPDDDEQATPSETSVSAIEAREKELRG